MNETAAGIETRVVELLGVLDADIEYMQRGLSWLDEMRGLVVKRDEAGLGRLLETIRLESEGYAANEQRRQSIRKELADILGCGEKQVTLSRLEDAVSGEQKTDIADRKNKLKALAAQLKREYHGTAMLLSDCARINELLLRSVLECGRAGAALYDASGAKARQDDAGFVNMRL
jgi:hypothetical protein